MSCRTFRRYRCLLGLLLSLVATGCGSGRYPVTGQATYDDGSPVPGGTIIAEATVDEQPVSVQGNIEPDGTFELGADVPGDGALPGHYRAMVLPVALGDRERAEGKQPTVPGKYGKFESSGITFDVKPEANVLNITIARQK